MFDIRPQAKERGLKQSRLLLILTKGVRHMQSEPGPE